MFTIPDRWYDIYSEVPTVSGHYACMGFGHINEWIIMSKVITSPVEQFSGEVTLHDPLTYPQLFAFQDAMDAATVLREEEEASIYVWNYAILPGIFACVENWDLKNVSNGATPETFPSTPALASVETISWLVGEIASLVIEAETVKKV
jgi:hypothetical protein